MKRIHLLFSIIILIGACASNQDARSLSLEGKSNSAILLIDIADSDLAYALNIVKFVPSTRQTVPMRGWAEFRVSDDTSRYLAVAVPPGDYVVQDVTQQDIWAVCFHESSYYFNAEPGQITYLGSFRALKNLAQLSYIAVTTRKTYSMHRERIHFFDNILEPEFDLSQASIDAARTFVSEQIPGAVQFSFKPANFQSTKFNTGRSLLGQRLCSGYNIGNKNQKADR